MSDYGIGLLIVRVIAAILLAVLAAASVTVIGISGIRRTLLATQVGDGCLDRIFRQH